MLENRLEAGAGVEPCQGELLLRYLDQLVYPDISTAVLTLAGVAICSVNLAVYALRMWSRKPPWVNWCCNHSWKEGGFRRGLAVLAN